MLSKARSRVVVCRHRRLPTGLPRSLPSSKPELQVAGIQDYATSLEVILRFFTNSARKIYLHRGEAQDGFENARIHSVPVCRLLTWSSMNQTECYPPEFLLIKLNKVRVRSCLPYLSKFGWCVVGGRGDDRLKGACGTQNLFKHPLYIFP